MEDFILDTMDGASKINFELVFKSIGFGLLILWFFVLVWVWMDSGQRSRNWVFRIASVLLVAVLNILGLVIYLLIRPDDSLETVYWSDLERRYLLYETADLGDCENCGFHLHPGFNVCPSCSFPIKSECSKCKLMINRDWPFCPFCSTEQEGVLTDQELIDSAKQMTLTEASLASAAALRSNDKYVKKDEKKAEVEKEPSPTVEESEIKPVVIEEIETEEPVVETKAPIKPSDKEIDRSIEEKEGAIDKAIQDSPSTYTKNKGTAERLGNYIISSVYGFGEKIHKTALSVSGPMREEPVSKVDESETENKAKGEVDPAVSESESEEDEKKQDTSSKKSKKTKTKKTKKRKSKKKGSKK